MEQELQSLKQLALLELSQADNMDALNELRVKYLGKKGSLTSALKGMGALSAEERPRIGQIVNDIRSELENIIQTKSEGFKQADLERKLASEKIDVTLPGRKVNVGHQHPLTVTLVRIKEIFMRMGFAIAEGPEVEQDYYNFEALNLPKDHPARDMQDSFYITEEFLMRTHTSPVQVRTMQAAVPNQPIRIIAPGKVYRRDYDATHSPMFHQVEGLVIDKNISFADLKGTLELS